MPTQKRKKRAEVTPEVKQEVRNLLTKTPSLSGKELKASVEGKLKKDYNLDVDYTIRTYQNEINRNLPDIQVMKDSGLDVAWHLGMLQKNPLPPQVVKRILSIQKNKRSRITVRVVNWITLLSESFKDDNKLYRTALSYALWEIYCAIKKEPFNTTPLDRELSRKGEVTSVIRELLLDKQKADCIEASFYQLQGLGNGNSYIEFLSNKDGEANG